MSCSPSPSRLKGASSPVGFPPENKAQEGQPEEQGGQEQGPSLEPEALYLPHLLIEAVAAEGDEAEGASPPADPGRGALWGCLVPGANG